MHNAHEIPVYGGLPLSGLLDCSLLDGGSKIFQISKLIMGWLCFMSPLTKSEGRGRWRSTHWVDITLFSPTYQNTSSKSKDIKGTIKDLESIEFKMPRLLLDIKERREKRKPRILCRWSKQTQRDIKISGRSQVIKISWRGGHHLHSACNCRSQI